ncbi:MAG: hypothetical protein LBN01_01935 [Endomicrobium sp.]|jgi:peptidoglycan hydrolase CwlO-like protein|nr:hypothetical protein [Endomicrobium sp.]
MKKMFVALLIASFLISGCNKVVTNNPGNAEPPKFEITGDVTKYEFWESLYGATNNWIKENPLGLIIIGTALCLVYKLVAPRLTTAQKALGARLEKVENKVAKVETDVAKLGTDVAKVGTDVEKANTGMGELKDIVNAIKAKTDNCAQAD